MIHYKKVIKEWRDQENGYQWQDIAYESPWIDHWFSFPVLRLGQFFSPYNHRLKLPSSYRDWAISHRGIFNLYFEDVRGEKHVVFPMVTTAYAIAASASMLFIAGKDKGETKYYTRLADFDTLGHNPILPGFWSAKAAGETQWKEVKPPILQGKAALLLGITIFQTGEGNRARELRIEGLDQDGCYGYYRKMINDDTWEFSSL